MNDLTLALELNSSFMLKYADDIAITVPIFDNFRDVTRIIEHVTNWCDDNKMKLNISKSKHLFFNKTFSDYFPSMPIDFCDSVRYLGVILNSKCSWTDHFIDISRKACSRIHTCSLRFNKSFAKFFQQETASIRLPGHH